VNSHLRIKDQAIVDPAGLQGLFEALKAHGYCAIGFCGHCQLGPEFICKDGPIYSYNRIANWLGIREL
jgi:Iron-sulfur cluster binding domain of dihydroorotate dehydrogenase B